MMKRLLLISMLAVILVATACGGKEDNGGNLKLTLEELAQYDGKDGQPAYIAVNGKIYDVTDVPQWKNGEHNGFSAGSELTEEMRDISPHGFSKLQLVPEIGELVE